MRYRNVGKTGLAVSEIGFGCGGNAGLMVRGTEAEQRRVIEHALARGVTYFDTAPDYGDGLAEINLGRALTALGARPVVTTKVEVRAENLDDIAGHVERSTEASLQRLGLDAVDVLQIHNGPVPQPTALTGCAYSTLGLEDFLRPGGALEGVERVLRAGKARYAGFICRGNDAAQALELVQTDLFRLLNVPYTLLNPTAGHAWPDGPVALPDYGDIITRAQALGAGVAAFSPLAGGLLTPAVLEGQGVHPLARSRDVVSYEASGLARKARAFAALAADNGISLVELAYRFILGHDGIATIIGGISSVEQLDDSVGAVARGPLPPPLTAAVERIWCGWLEDGDVGQANR
ncbi:aldo/keto reductase [Ancylobacter polymorphus]|uniref:L-glyceraldehyde 3-phosphate reductase n=1 Tax=Ancylobacter polymorphus TaxID=223390 RepID=A0ABU0BI10_9HYPH|nr:aldo/keto reductase [Ancylobacter polymorphus]MDQ0304946.1 L-glyceraldehyde 3-phosphate reductase [Ancylobacter polymorphus]